MKRATAAAAALAVSLSLASCGKDTSWGADIDGTRIRAGIMIYFQSSAVSEAYGHLQEGQEDVLAITIDDQPSREWINNKAVESMRRYAAVENKFSELGLSFQNKEDELVKINAGQWWEYLGEYYEGMGISEQSYLDVCVNSEKERAIFNYYYGEGGEREVPQDEIKAYLNENNARIKYIEMPLKDGEGNVLKSEEKAKIINMAEEYIERMKNGESFEAISAENDKYYASLSASDNETSDVVNFDDLQVAEDELGTVISNKATIPSASAVEKIFSGEITEGNYTIVEEYEAAYIVYRMDLFADEEYFESHRSSAIQSMKSDEFDEMVDGWIAAQNVVINNDAFDRYKLDKIVE